MWNSIIKYCNTQHKRQVIIRWLKVVSQGMLLFLFLQDPLWFHTEVCKFYYTWSWTCPQVNSTVWKLVLLFMSYMSRPTLCLLKMPFYYRIKLVRYISLVQWSYASKKEGPLGFFLVHVSGTLYAFLEGCKTVPLIHSFHESARHQLQTASVMVY